jgi:hypothetical protein
MVLLLRELVRVPSGGGGSAHPPIADGAVNRGNWRRDAGVDEASTLALPILSCVKGGQMPENFGLVIMLPK